MHRPSVKPTSELLPMSYRVVLTDQVFPDTEIERKLLAEIDATLEVVDGDSTALLEAARGADALLNTYLPLDGELIAGLEGCKIIARYGIGVDNVDLDAAREHGMVVTNVPDYCLEEVAVHALALLLSLLRKIPQGDAEVRAGGWGIGALRPIKRISETTVGLVGYGRIGRRLAEALRVLGAEVLVADPYLSEVEGARLVALDELLKTADAVSLHSPLTEETRGMIAAPQLRQMRADAVLVNTSRGPLVVLEDVLQALRDGEIRAAALDVFDSEPPDVTRLEGVPGLLVTPHAAFYSEQAVAESQRKAATQIVKVLTGQAPDYLVA